MRVVLEALLPETTRVYTSIPASILDLVGGVGVVVEGGPFWFQRQPFVLFHIPAFTKGVPRSWSST